MDDEQAQEDELTALSSIYEEAIFQHFLLKDRENPERMQRAGLLSIDIPLEMGLKIVSHNKDGTEEIHTVQYLPDLVLRFRFPISYPSKSPPVIFIVCPWLPTRTILDLKKELESVWAENQGMPVLFTYISYLQEAVPKLIPASVTLQLNNLCVAEAAKNLICDTEKSFSTQNFRQKSLPSVPRRTDRDPYTQSVLLTLLLDTDQTKRRLNFESRHTECSVCFGGFLGKDCVEFVKCRHVFCKECVRTYFEVQLQEGQVNAMHCLADTCDTAALPYQIRESLGEEQFKRYDQLLLNRTLDLMNDIKQCPRPNCRAPAILDSPVSDSQDASPGPTLRGDAKLAICSQCSFAFCVFCNRAYHGVAPCRLVGIERDELVKQYQEGSREVKMSLEVRYGKRQLQDFVDETLVDTWKKENTKKCPHCGVPIERKEGCNKMSCTKCGHFFCWLCGRLLDLRNPYGHFNNPQSPCFNRLFIGTEMDDHGDEWMFV